MKKTILSLVLFLGFSGMAMAQSLSVSDVEVVPGTTGKYALKINVGSGEYTGFQYDIQFPATGFSTPGSSKFTVNTLWEDGTISPGDLKDGAGKVSSLSISNSLIPTGEIEIGTISFSVAGNVALGEYDVTISNFEFLSGSTRTSVDGVTFKVKVVNRLSVLLDEESTAAPVAASDVNVTVKRTINADSWSTICLPFAMSAEQVTAAFGNDVQLADFTGYDVTEEGGITVGITVNFSSVSAIEANHPYIIKVSSAIAEFTVDGVEIEPVSEPQINNGTSKKPKSFIGTYVADFDFYNAAKNYPLFLSGNKFYYATGNTQHMKAFRAYFDFDDNLAEAESSSVKMQIFVDEEETKVEGLSMGDSDETIYDLNGRKVLKPQQHGVYIVNGKKVLK